MASQLPAVVGLTICRDFVRDADSGNYSVIRSFTGQPFDSFPGTADPFCVFAILTDAIGAADAQLIITWFGEDEIVEYARIRGTVDFQDRLQVVECVYRFRKLSFSGPGIYLFTLFIDGEWMAQKAMRVSLQESHS